MPRAQRSKVMQALGYETDNVPTERYTISIPSGKSYSITLASGTTHAVEVDSPNSVVDTLLFTYSTEIALPAGQSADVPVSVDWKYKGQYSGQELEVIHSESVISLSH